LAVKTSKEALNQPAFMFVKTCFIYFICFLFNLTFIWCFDLQKASTIFQMF